MEVSIFSKTVFDVSQMLGEQDLEAITYLHRLPDDYRESTHKLKALRELERKGLFSASDPEGLKNLLQRINRNDICQLVDEYCHQVRFEKFRPCTTYLELCIAQATDLKLQLGDIQRSLVEYSSMHKTTPAQTKFYGGIHNRLGLLQANVDRFMLAPLDDLQRNMVGTGRGSTSEDHREGIADIQMKERRTSHDIGHKQQTSKRPENALETDGTKRHAAKRKVPSEKHNRATPTVTYTKHSESVSISSGRMYRSKSMEWNNSGDYDILEPKNNSTKNSPQSGNDKLHTVKNRKLALSDGSVKYERPGHTSNSSHGTKIPVPTRPAKGVADVRVLAGKLSSSFPSLKDPHSRPSSPISKRLGVTQGPGSSPLRQRASFHRRSSMSSYYSDYETCSGDDSGFADIGEVRRQLNCDYIESKSEVSNPLYIPPSHSDPQIYATLDQSRTDPKSIYERVQIKSRH